MECSYFGKTKVERDVFCGTDCVEAGGGGRVCGGADSQGGSLQKLLVVELTVDNTNVAGRTQKKAVRFSRSEKSCKVLTALRAGEA
jgi:hypothetical protein